MSKKQCCYGYGLWAIGDACPMGPIDASDGLPTRECPTCHKNANPMKPTMKRKKKDTQFIACFVINDPDTGKEVELEIHKDIQANALFAVESSFIDKNPGVCNSLYNDVQLLPDDCPANTFVMKLVIPVVKLK